ncbi:MAG: YbjQ family protein [Acidobacteriota bacterium]|nr:YbjQ family protein [Acidobacteriota bacterium]
MIVVSSDLIPGRRIAATLGLVKGNAVRARPVFRDIMALLRGLVGGEIPEYTKMLAETREQALDRMIGEARALDADAIVAARFITAQTMAGAAELLVYGTAVKLER